MAIKGGEQRLSGQGGGSQGQERGSASLHAKRALPGRPGSQARSSISFKNHTINWAVSITAGLLAQQPPAEAAAAQRMGHWRWWLEAHEAASERQLPRCQPRLLNPAAHNRGSCAVLIGKLARR